MLVCEKEKWIFVRNPKTASRSLNDFLKNKYECTEYALYHSVDIPEIYKDYKIYYVVRNPFTRAVSAWKHVILDRKIAKNNTPFTFKDFLNRKKFTPKDGDCDFFLQSTAYNRIKNYNVILLRYENLKKDVYNFFGKGDLPFIGKTQGDKWIDTYDEETYNLAIDSLNEDFKEFNYSKKIQKMF
jgi:hypothetical protein